MIALIDGDVVVYGCGFAAQKNSHKITIKGEEEYGWQAAFAYKKQVNEWLEFKKLTKDDVVITTDLIVEPLHHCLHMVDLTINNILQETNSKEFVVFLTGKDNFREKIATIAPYKGNRKEEARPHWYQEIRTHLIRKYNANIIDGQEADDAIGIEQYRNWKAYQDDEAICNTTIVSIDKDLNMIPGWHYNFKTGERYWIDEQQAIKNFYLQLLTGDKTDNIIGIPGIGPVKAEYFLSDCIHEMDMYSVALELYEEAFPNRNYNAILNENAQLLWIRREKGQQWQPPTERH